MKLYDELISLLKNQINKMYESEQEILLPRAEDTAVANTAIDSEAFQDIHSAPESNSFDRIAAKASGELYEMQIDQVIQTSDGVKQEVDPRCFRVHNSARNQSLDIIITGQSIRSRTGLQGDDKG